MIKIIGDWGVESLAPVQEIATFTYKIFANFVGHELDCDIRTYNNPLQGYPLAHYDKVDGDFVITLSCDSGEYWAQVAYQLAHEICHLYSNHSQQRNHKFKWLEESFCEAASLAVLSYMAEHWTEFTLGKVTPSFAGAIDDYVQNLRAKATQTFKTSKEFTDWLSSNMELLEASSTNRELNRIVAFYLYDEVLSIEPSVWAIVETLNTWDCGSDSNFDEFNSSWRAKCEEFSQKLDCVDLLATKA
ncbi:hypothetical protein [Vibrio sp. SCSIO 43155]|uniref:hypothetical protein n=1 Tax=Vibrio sp. SCSIO 43155 TaxID=2819099 RepID=UPI0020758635|nr:hypothetical protein [Vibrio sp. SCSIO 43155]USD53664.1 hypothetical protein J4N44_10145 [Vibrio sp. SCSIO 43155]